MRCETVRRFMIRLADDEPAGGNKIRNVIAHINSCSRCRRELSLLAEQKKLLAKYLRLPWDADFIVRLFGRIKDEGLTQSAAGDRHPWAGGIVTAVAMIAAAILFACSLYLLSAGGMPTVSEFL